MMLRRGYRDVTGLQLLTRQLRGVCVCVCVSMCVCVHACLRMCLCVRVLGEQRTYRSDLNTALTDRDVF